MAPEHGKTGHGETAGVIAPPPLIFAAFIGLGLLLDLYRPVALLPEEWRWQVAGGLALAAGGFGSAAVLHFLRARTHILPHRPTSALVTGGVYRLTRNPMYLALTLLFLAVGAASNSVWFLVLLPVVMAVMYWGVIRREERYLTRLFGDDYRAYCKQVRRWL